MEAFTVKGLLVLVAVLHPGLAFLIKPFSCQSGGREYHVGDTWVEDCRQCQCLSSMFTMMMAVVQCSSHDVCTHSSVDGGLSSATSPPQVGVPKQEHCLVVQDCHHYFDFCRTRLESTDCVHGTCQCIPDYPAQGFAPYCRRPSDCVSEASVCQALFEDTACFFGNCQCVPKGATMGRYNVCQKDSECSVLSLLCESQHGTPLCYRGFCLCEAEEPCVYGTRTYEQHEVWTDRELCKSCVCSDNGTALCVPLSNSTSCSPPGTMATTVVSASEEPTTTAMKASTTTVLPTTTTTTKTSTTIQTTTGDATPVLTWVSPNVTVTKGDNFTLSCNASGVPPPAITWGHIDLMGFPEDLHAFSNVEVEEGNLHVTGATNQNAGRFFCRAQNRAGHSVGRIYVTVLGTSDLRH